MFTDNLAVQLITPITTCTAVRYSPIKKKFRNLSATSTCVSFAISIELVWEGSYLDKFLSTIGMNDGYSLDETEIQVWLSELFPLINRAKHIIQNVDARMRPAGKRPPSELMTNI